MKLPLETLLQSIGQAVQQAQTGMEIGAEQLYWQTWQQSDDPAGTCRPICRRLEIPMGPGQEPRILELPVTALYHHQPMALDTVADPEQPQAGDTSGNQIYVPGFGWVENHGGGGSGTAAEDMYENGNKIGIMD